MPLKRGINKPYLEGVYLTKNELFIWEYKVFHENTKELTHLLAKEFRSNETVGPMLIGEEDFSLEIERVLEEKSKLMYAELAKNKQ